MTKTIDTLHPAVTAADYAVAALGPYGGKLLLQALRAGWLTHKEAVVLEPLAVGVAFLLGDIDVPLHRGHPAQIKVKA